MYETEMNRLKEQNDFTMDDLRLIIKILRSENGCPWDKEQTHKSIIPGIIEETYEVVEAIEAENTDMLTEELGDVLLQIVFHAQLEEEKGIKAFDEVVNGICRKMIVRHPHVFGDVKADNSAEVLRNWDKIKSEIKKQETLGEKLDSVAKTLPALMRAQKLIHKAAKVGVKADTEGMSGDEAEAGKAILFALYKCEELGVDAETLLRHMSDDFVTKVKESGK